MSYFEDSKWKKYLKESCGAPHSREPESPEDNEGQMARSQLLQILSSAQILMQFIDDGEQLPAWVQSKLTKAADYLKAAESNQEYDEFAAAEQGSTLTLEEKPCWDGYEMVGMKMKDGKEVPNCVPRD